MSDDSLLGLQLDEYRLEALLGKGGMARVYRGLDTNLNRFVAVKVIDTPFRSDEEYVKRFKIEAQAIARLDHPHVVRLYRYGEVNGMLYMAMQFIEGADLSFLLESYRLDGEFIPAADALRLITEICQALDYVHAHGIIHRDIKPSNIMLTRDEARVIITDFGLALRAEVGTRGEVFGSPHYIAPEQAVSSARSVPQSDLYAVGVILYEMFTGVLPFTAAEPMDVAVMHMSQPPTPPRELRPELTPEVEAVILKALEKKPEDRYQSGRALSLALDRALKRQPEEVLPTNRSIPERVTIGLLANPLPVLPPIPAAVTPHQQAVAPTASPVAPKEPAAEGGPPPTPMKQTPAAAAPAPVPAAAEPAASEAASAAIPPTPAASPAAPSQPLAPKKPAPWVLITAAALLGICLFACLTVGGVALLLNRNNAQTGGVVQRTVAPGDDSEAPVPISPTQAPGVGAASPVSPPAPGDYLLQLTQCEEEGCVLVRNTGSRAFPLPELTLSGKDGSLSGAEWGVDLLMPGQCVIVVKNEEWLDEADGNESCELVGHPLLREGKKRFWENGFSVKYEDQQVGACEKKQRQCDVTIKR